MLWFDKIKVAIEYFCGSQKPIKIWDVDVNNLVISKLVEIKYNSKYLIGYLDEFIRPLVLLFPNMSGDFKTFKGKDRDNNKNEALRSLRLDDDRLLEKYKTIRIKIKDLTAT